MSLISLCGVEVTAIAGQPFIIAFEARDATGNLIGGTEVSVTADGAPAVRFENSRPYNMKKTGRVGANKGVAEFSVTAPAQEFDIHAKCGADTATVAVKVAPSSIVQTAGGAAIQGADGRVYAIPAHHSHAAIVGMPAPAGPVVNAIPASGTDIIIIDY